MLRAVMDTINDDTLLPALAIELKSVCHCPGRENGCAKCAMRLRRPDGPGEAEKRKKIMWAWTTATRIVGNLAASKAGRAANDGEILEPPLDPAWQGCELPVPMT